MITKYWPMFADTWKYCESIPCTLSKIIHALMPNNPQKIKLSGITKNVTFMIGKGRNRHLFLTNISKAI